MTLPPPSKNGTPATYKTGVGDLRFDHGRRKNVHFAEAKSRFFNIKTNACSAMLQEHINSYAYFLVFFYEDFDTLQASAE